MSSTHTLLRQSVVPDPIRSEDEHRRYRHVDLVEPDFAGRRPTAHQLAAEAAVLWRWLSSRRYHRSRPRWICGPDVATTDQDWAAERIARIRQVLERTEATSRHVA